MQLSHEDARALAAYGLSVDFYAVYTVGLDAVFAAVHLAMAVVIFARRSDDWLALFAAFTLLTFGLVTFPEAWALLGADPPAWWLAVQFLTFVGSVCILIFLYVFPNGQFVPRWTRWLAIAWVLEEAWRYFFPGWEILPPGWRSALFASAFVGAVGAGLFAQVYRYRRVSNSVQRQQTKWVVFGVTAALAGVLGLGLPLSILPSLEAKPLIGLAANTAFHLFLLLIPLSIGLAMLRSRLWDIDLLIRRTLIYGVLTGLLALVYFAGVVLLQAGFRAMSGQAVQSPLAIVASTLAIAALFNPLRRRVQDFIDRRFYRRKYDAARTLAEFAASARDETDLDRLGERLVQVVNETMQPVHASLWLNSTADRRQSGRKP